MNHAEKLIELYNKSLHYNLPKTNKLGKKYTGYLNCISDNSLSQKGVFTVLVTLVIHKILHPTQDIRLHQSSMKGGFSGRTIDTQFITPMLKKLKLPSMAESGWLTRSLEQPYPYSLEYNGKISNKQVKEAFLGTLDFVQNYSDNSESIMLYLLSKVIVKIQENQVSITKISNPDFLDINSILNILKEHFSFKYNTHGGSKLPVIALYAIYKVMISELSRYYECTLATLGSHTASDLTSKTAGDIQIFKNGKPFEILEIKHDKFIDENTVAIAVEKIQKYNPSRYYILSFKGILDSDRKRIDEIINHTRMEHGCQIIVNGIMDTIKYYLRLISSSKDFLDTYIQIVEKDSELKPIHKEKLVKIINNLQSINNN